MLKVYPAIFHEEEGSFWVEFPDLEGCQSCGASLAETMEMAQEALGLYIVSLLEDGIEIPNPSNIKDLHAEDGEASYVSVDIDKYRRKTKAIKKTLSIPEWLNEQAEQNHINFSAVLQNALKEKLGL